MVLFVLLANTVFSYAQTSETQSSDEAQNVEASLNLSPEVESRMGNALAAFEKMKQAGRYISSIADLIKGTQMPMPVGIKSGTYTICIEEVYVDSVANVEKLLAKAICIIPVIGGKSLAFEGVAQIEGDNGMGTQGRLELIGPIEKKLGKESSIVFREGTSVLFGCDGFKEVDANLAFILKRDKIYCVDDGGRNTGKLMFDARTRFSDIEDFSIDINSVKSFRIDGLDGFTFTLNNLILDHSSYSTPATADFPTNYFRGGDAEESRKKWQGLAISGASVTLPDFMTDGKGDGQKQRKTLQLENVLIDGSGLTCKAEAKNIISDSSIDAKSWDISVNDFALEIDRNFISGVGFAGKINIPPLGKSSMLDYVANYDVEQKTFVLQSSLGKRLDFPMLCAKLTLDETSTISLKIGNGGIYPRINANGLLSVEAPMGCDTANSKLVLPDLRFEGMEISRDRFELGTTALTGKLETPSMAGFKLTLNDIRTVKNGEGQGLSIDAAVAVNEMFKGDAGIALYGDEKTWKFNKVKVDKIHVEYESGAFSVYGGVEFVDGDEIYGKGFRGDIKFTLIDKFRIDAVGVFGHKDNYRYFLTDLFYETRPASGIQVAPALSFYGFGGGLYRHMQQSMKKSQSEFGKSLTGICYTPDRKVGMGFMARTKFGLIGSDKLFDADVSFEMQFNNNWGVNFVQLRGEATMLSAAQQASMIEGIKKNIEKAAKNSYNIAEFDKESLETRPEKEGALTATVGMKFDMENDVFTSDMNAYLDVAGVLTGRGENNRMGWANAYFSKDKWYTYIGTPSERLGVSLLGIADAGGYFMVGNDIPELPEMPEKVKRNLSASYVNQLSSRTDGSKLTDGKGLAFGSDFSVNFDATLQPFYAHLGIGMGTEMLLKQYGEAAHCKGREGHLGIDGWYAQAQAWAWVYAAIGMKVKVFRKKRKFDILSGEMAAFLRGAGPKPMYFTGAVGGQFNILGGLVKGRCNFDFTIGDKCEIVGGSPFGEDVIAQVTPADKSDDVNVFVAPQLVLNIPADEKMTIEDEAGRKETYRVSIADFSVQNVETGSKAKYTTEGSEDGRIWTYDLDEPLESHKQYRAYAKVAFERLDGDRWVAVSGDDGKPYFEEKSIEFTSGERPKYILPEHVAHAYPADRQYNFLTKEYDDAYVMLSKDYSYLFTTEKPAGFDQKVQFTTFDGKTIDAAFTHKTVSNVNGVKFEVDIPTKYINLANDQIYNMAIVNVPQRTTAFNENIEDKETKVETEAGCDVTETKHEAQRNLEMLEQTEIYSVDFRTSSYRTFSDKMNAMDVGDVIPWQHYPYVYALINNIYDNTALAEIFDESEYGDADYNKRLIQFEVDYNSTEWYKTYVAPNIYENVSLRSFLGDINPPSNQDVVSVEFRSLSLPRLDDTMIEANIRPNKSHYGAITNNCLKYIDEDRMRYRTEIANKASHGVDMGKVNAFMSLDHIPALTFGEYPYIIKYVLPGKGLVTTKYRINVSYNK